MRKKFFLKKAKKCTCVLLALYMLLTCLPMGFTARAETMGQALVRVAQGEVGYLEKASNYNLYDKTANSGNGNYTKYGAWYGVNPGAWCAVFVSWCADQAGIPQSVVPKFSVVSTGAKFFKDNGRWRDAGYTPSPGDLIFFDGHVGIVEYVSGGTVHTIEGNYSDKCTRVKRTGGILGYGILGGGETAQWDFNKPATYPSYPGYMGISYIRSGETVRFLQTALNWLGYNCGEADGIFGSNTANAVKSFQGANGLSVDGIVGEQTWNALTDKLKGSECKTAHQWRSAAVTKPASLGEAGVITKVCSLCEYTESIYVAAVKSVELSKTSYVYDRGENIPAVAVTDANGDLLTSGKDYTVKYSGNGKLPGTYTVTVNFAGNYCGTVNKTFSVEKQTVSADNITISVPLIYNCSVQRPAVTVKTAQGVTMTEGVSYTVKYSSTPKAPGVYTVTVTGKGNFTGTAKKTFVIKKQSITDGNVILSASSFSYNGNVQKPVITVKTAEGVIMTEGISYTVTYSAEPKAKGTYTVTVEAKGNFIGTAKKTFTIK